jgi:hypothetical protein
MAPSPPRILPLFGKVDAGYDLRSIRAWAANYNGQFATVEVVLDSGTASAIPSR